MPRSVNARRLAQIGPPPPRLLPWGVGGVYPQKTDVKEKEKENGRTDHFPDLYFSNPPLVDQGLALYDCRIIFHNDDSHVALPVSTVLCFPFFFYGAYRYAHTARRREM